MILSDNMKTSKNHNMKTSKNIAILLIALILLAVISVFLMQAVQAPKPAEIKSQSEAVQKTVETGSAIENVGSALSDLDQLLSEP